MPLPLPTDFTGPNITEAQFKTAMTDLINHLAALETTPVGTIAAFAMSTAPSGFLKANGAAISRSTYSALFAKIGTTYGAGDGSTTFNLPDLRGYFPRAWDDGRGVDAGRAIGSTQADRNLSHSHTGSTNSTGSHSHTYPVRSDSDGSTPALYLGNTSGSAGSSSAGAHSHTVTIYANGDVESRPKNIALLFCIKY